MYGGELDALIDADMAEGVHKTTKEIQSYQKMKAPRARCSRYKKGK